MIKITFPDGNVKEFERGITAFQIAESISPRLAADVLCASVNGTVYDLDRPINEDASNSTNGKTPKPRLPSGTPPRT